MRRRRPPVHDAPRTALRSLSDRPDDHPATGGHTVL